jgi:hypothetical protein
VLLTLRENPLRPSSDEKQKRIGRLRRRSQCEQQLTSGDARTIAAELGGFGAAFVASTPNWQPVSAECSMSSIFSWVSS